MWCCSPIISVLRKLKPGDLKFKASVGYISVFLSVSIPLPCCSEAKPGAFPPPEVVRALLGDSTSCCDCLSKASPQTSLSMPTTLCGCDLPVFCQTLLSTPSCPSGEMFIAGWGRIAWGQDSLGPGDSFRFDCFFNILDFFSAAILISL